MIGNDDLVRAYEDTGWSADVMPNTVEGGEAMVRSAEVDPDAAFRIAQRAARHVMDWIEDGDRVSETLTRAVMTGLLIGIRAGRVDAVRLTEEFSRDE